MSPTLELDLEQNAWKARRKALRRWLTDMDEPGFDFARLAGEFGRLARSQADDRHDFRASILEAILRVAEDTSRGHIETINHFYQQVIDLRIASCDILLNIADKLSERGLAVEGTDELREAVADYRRWKEDLPDELILRYGPVRQRLAAAVEEGLRNSPAASNWRELFDD